MGGRWAAGGTGRQVFGKPVHEAPSHWVPAPYRESPFHWAPSHEAQSASGRHRTKSERGAPQDGLRPHWTGCVGVRLPGLVLEQPRIDMAGDRHGTRLGR
jgi:hypothetical protein